MNKQNKQAKIKYFDLYGLRKEKYQFLETHDIKNTKWQELNPREPYYFFVPKAEKGRKKYEKFWKITDIFPVNSVGIVTARDKFVIDSNRQALEQRIRIFCESRDDDEFIKLTYGLQDKPNWKIKKARQELKKLEDWEDYFTKILYRPFDERWIYYHPAIIERHREEVMKHMMQENVALLAKRQNKQEFSYVFVSDKLAESCVFESSYANNSVFPLYLYNNKEIKKEKKRNPYTVMMVFDKSKYSYQDRKPNINQKLLDLLKNTFGKEPSPEEIFYYIYAVLYSNIYRQKYQEFLKIDFPRVPITCDYQIFKKMAKLGSQLVDLHLLKSNKLKNQIAKFYGQGDNTVKFRKYDQKNQRLYINEQKYFEPIKKQVWEYMIGGYQVLDKWLKSKINKNLAADDIKHFCSIVGALTETRRLQGRIDKLYNQVELQII